MKRLALALCAALALGALGAIAASREPPELRETVYVFGTLIEIVIRGENEAKARSAAVAVGDLLQELHSDWHAWRPGQLGDVNAAIAKGDLAKVDDRLAAVLREGRLLGCESGGLFEPAIGGLVGLWGFHADTPPEGALPDTRDLADLVRARPQIADLIIDDTSVSSRNPAVQLDLGGFAKGAALDLAAEQLRANGIQDAVLNAGGDVNVLGRHGGRAWRVAIRDPFVWGAVAAVSLAPGEVLYTSGNYERYFEHGGARFAHIIDPLTGKPVQDIVSVTVLGRNGTRADAAATALSVAGPEAWPATARAMGTDTVLVIDRHGRIMATPAMRDRLEPIAGDFPTQIETVTLPDIEQPECSRG